MTDRVQIFSNGSQYADWQTFNCLCCEKWSEWDGFPTCELEIALSDAFFDDGTVSQDIATRTGYTPGKDNWQCGEVERTEEWKAEKRIPHLGE